MKILVNEKISQHKYKTPEGYLICVDSVLARTGPQTYRKNELFVDAEDDSEIEVGRSPDEVFAPETLASFENKPITVEHPHEDVNIENYKDYAVGFVRDVKQGKFDGQDVILGTLVITDKDAIEGIENGEHVELSCGYDCDIEDGDDGYQQKHIRGNHVALCEAGRAGIAKIIDSVEDEDTVKYKGYTLKLHKGYNMWLNMKDYYEVFDERGNKVAMKKDLKSAKEYVDNGGFKDSVEDAKKYAVEFTYGGDEWSPYLGQVWVYANSEKEALKKAEEYASNHIPYSRDYVYGSGKIVPKAYSNSPVIDAVEDAGEPRLDRAQRRMLQNYLSMISTFTTRDTDIKDVLRPLSGKGFKYTIDKIEGWIWKKGEMAYKNYYLSLDGYKDKFMVTLYADPNKDWKVNEVNAYFTDSVKDETLYTVGYTGSIYTRDLKTKEFNDYNSALSFAKKMYRNPRNHTVKIYEGNIDGKVIWIQSKLGAGDSEVRDEDDKEKNFEIEYLDNNDAKCTQTVPAKTAKEAERKLKEVLPVYRILSVKQTKDSTPDEEQTEKLEEDVETFDDFEVTKELVRELVQEYREDAEGFDGLRDYVETQYPRHPKEFKQKLLKEMKKMMGDSISDSKVKDLNLNEKVSTSDLQNFINKLTKKYLKEPYNANEWGTIDMKTGDPVLLKVQIILWMDVDKNWKPAMGKDLSELNNIRWEVGIYQKGASSRPGGDRREKEWSANSVKEAISQIPQVAKYANELYDDIVKGMKDSMEDAKELSATSVDYLDEMIERYRRKHPQAEFGEIEKRKDYYVVKILKDSMQEVPDKLVKEFERQLSRFGIQIKAKGKTWSGSKHYQVEYYGGMGDFQRILEKLNTWCESQKIPFTYNYTDNGRGGYDAGIDLHRISVPDSKLNDDKFSTAKKEIIAWWKEVEKWNKNAGHPFNIENNYDNAYDLWSAMFDMFTESKLKAERPDLAKQGQRIYKKWEYDFNWTFNDSINDAKEVRYQGYVIQEYHPLHDDPEGDGYIISKNGIIVGGADSIDEAIRKINRKELKKDSVEDRKNNVDKTKESTAIRQLIDILENGLAKKYGYKLYPDKIDIIGGGQFKITTQQYNRLKELGYSGIEDSINDVDPRSGESKEDFIARFMKETKNEYPDEKQRLAVAYSYWEKKGRDSKVKDINPDYANCLRELDKDVNQLYKLYQHGDKAPSTILRNMGYKEVGDDRFMMKSGLNKMIIEFDDFSDYIKYYVVDESGQIPKGYTVTKFKFYDSKPKDSIYAISVQGQKSKKLVRAKDAREAIDKYNKMFPKDKIKSVKKTDKFNNIIETITR